MSFANMKVGSRLLASFGVVIVALVVVGGVGVVGLRELNVDMATIVEDLFPKVVAANSINDDVNIIEIHLRNMMIVADKEAIKKEKALVLEARARVGANVEQLDKTIQSPEGRALVAKMKETRAAYVRSSEAFIKLVEDGKTDEARALLLGEVVKTQDAYMTVIDGVMELQT
jgi:methyl-accepting chemotaxis protein